MTSPLDRSRAALPYNIRKTLEESNLPVEVAVAIADEIDRLRAGWIEADRIALEARIRDAKQTRPEEERWIACRDRMPENGDKVVACWGDGWKYIAFRIGGEWRNSNRERNHDQDVTHWMPLPASPIPQRSEVKFKC